MRVTASRQGLWVAIVCAAFLTCIACGDDDDPCRCPTGHVTWMVNPDGTGHFVTISRAIEAARDGDMIRVAAGTYAESLIIKGKSITLRGSGPEDCIVKDSGVQYDDAGLLWIGDDASVVITGFRFTDAYVGCGSGVNFDSSTVMMENCALIRCGLTAVDATLLLSGCTIFGNSQYLCDAILPVVRLSGGAIRLEQNIVVTNGGGGIVCASDANVSFECNDCWSMYGTPYAGCDDPTGTAGNISEDPRFVDTARDDFHLLPGSPCLPASRVGCGLMGAFGMGR